MKLQRGNRKLTLRSTSSAINLKKPEQIVPSVHKVFTKKKRISPFFICALDSFLFSNSSLLLIVCWTFQENHIFWSMNIDWLHICFTQTMIIIRILNGIPATCMLTPYGAGCMSTINVQSGVCRGRAVLCLMTAQGHSFCLNGWSNKQLKHILTEQGHNFILLVDRNIMPVALRTLRISCTRKHIIFQRYKILKIQC